jgi:hypothetical protein
LQPALGRVGELAQHDSAGHRGRIRVNVLLRRGRAGPAGVCVAGVYVSGVCVSVNDAGARIPGRES